MKQRLGDFAEIASAYPVRKRRVRPGAITAGVEPDPNGTHWAVTAKDIDPSFRIDSSKLLRVTPDADTIPYQIREGDLLFLSRSRYGAAAVYGLPENSFALGSIFILRVDPSRVHPKYLAWYFGLPDVQRALRQRENAGSMPFLRKAELSEFEVPLPPLEVQQTIGQIVELRFRECELASQIEELRKQVIDDALLRAAI